MTCTLHVPPVHPQLDGSGVRTGHVRGVCSFQWHTKNLIQYKDRWHTLGTERHGPYQAGRSVREPVDRDPYHGDGYWREVVIVYDQKGHFRQRVVGPVSEFSS